MAHDTGGPPRGQRGLPDHDGRPLSEERRAELCRRLGDIDRRYGGSHYRRAFRAALCRHYGDEAGEHREMALLLAEAGDWHELEYHEVDRLTMPLEMYLSRRGRGRN